jgi:hypothetical protein
MLRASHISQMRDAGIMQNVMRGMGWDGQERNKTRAAKLFRFRPQDERKFSSTHRRLIA